VSDSSVGLEERVLEAEERQEVRRALDHLDEKYRGVLIFFYYQKLTYDQIAAVLNVPAKTVETRLYRARKLLKERLQRAGVGGAV
jgi:RNA polymerase sigma-70 factor (ECF subfamily)